MKTQQIYLEDSYLKEMDGEILEIQPEGKRKMNVTDFINGFKSKLNLL